MSLVYGSLFSGVGGMDLGLDRAGMTCNWQVEINEYASRVLAKHWPNVRRHDDVKTFPPNDTEDWTVDLIAGGFPCTDISYAGKGAGLDGKQSGLWWEYARIVRDLRPRYVFIENVSALLTRGLDSVLGTLASYGYDAEWSCLQAADVGAPHLRDRVFILGYSEFARADPLATSSSSRGTVSESSRQPETLADAGRKRAERRREHGDMAGPPRTSQVDDEERQWHGDTVEYSRPALADAERTEWRSRDSQGCKLEHAPNGLQGGWKEDSSRPGVGRTNGSRSRTGHESRIFSGDARRQLDEFRRTNIGPGGCWEFDPAEIPESGVDRMVGRVANRLDRLRGLGNIVVPQVAEFIGRRIIQFHANQLALQESR